MKVLFRKLCSPILSYFESGQGEFIYQKSHRFILIVVGLLFLFLSLVSAFMAIDASQFGVFIPIVIFFIAGLVCIIVGCLGNERAVATIWGSK
jgi:hypothetical protein